MDIIEEYIEQFFDNRIPISNHNNKVKEAFLAEVIKEYDELHKQNTDEKCIEILKNKYGWADEENDWTGVGGVYMSIDGLTLIDCGIVFYPSEATNEAESRVYQLLEELCGISFCYTRMKDDFKFDCSAKFIVFALDQSRNYFGSIGDYCDFGELNIPIGYVCQEGLYGRIADNLKEFLELIVFYPYWYQIIQLGDSRNELAIEKLEQEWVARIPFFYEKQKEVSDVLNLSNNKKSLEILFTNLSMNPQFNVSDMNEEDNKYKKFFKSISKENPQK